MKKLIVSAMVMCAIFATSNVVVAQNNKKETQKTECCKDKEKKDCSKDKKESCCKKGDKKECSKSDKK